MAAEERQERDMNRDPITAQAGPAARAASNKQLFLPRADNCRPAAQELNQLVREARVPEPRT